MDIYVDKIDSLLKKNLTSRGFELWLRLKERIPDIWNKPSSSTLKYHKKTDENGRVPSVSEHTFEMIYSADKIIDMFPNTVNRDVIFLSIILHDSFKYGINGNTPHTENRHDKIIGDTIRDNKKLFLKLLNENDVNLLEEITRFHSGKWSTDADNEFSFYSHKPEVLFIHTLDMLSSKNLIKIIQENNNNDNSK